VATVIKAASPKIEVAGVEAEASHPFADSLRAGRIVEVSVGPSIADGLVGNMDPETITFSMCSAWWTGWPRSARSRWWLRFADWSPTSTWLPKGLVPPRSARPRAGSISGPRAAIVVSGSNIDADRLAALLSSGRSA